MSDKYLDGIMKRAQPSAEPAAPPREAGLGAEIDQTIKAWRSTTSGTDWKTYLPVRLTLLKRARDRLAAMDGDARSQAQDIARQNQHIAVLQSKLAQATARAEQLEHVVEDAADWVGFLPDKVAESALTKQWRPRALAALSSY